MKRDKLTSVTSMPFAITPKDHSVAIANKDSMMMDSTAPVGKRKRCMLTP